MGSRKVEVITARAVHRACEPGFDASATAAELVALAGGSWPVLLAALLRVDRALADRWSRVAANAADALRMALEAAEQAQPVHATAA